MPNLSIIVPVYGVSQYVRQCLQSILCQSYQDFEVLVIDDGSKDGSGEIADEIALQDPRVRVIHKENAGLPQARRTGVENARGAYIGFVDGDDYIEPSMYQVLMQKAIQEDADIVCCGCYTDSEGGDLLRNTNFKSGDATFTSQEALIQLWKMTGLANYLVNKVFRKPLFDGVEYATGNPVGEDYFLQIQLLGKSSKIAQVNTPLYHYVIHQNSMSRVGYDSARKESLLLFFKWRDVLLDQHPDCRSEILAFHLCVEMAALVDMGRNRVIDVEMAKRIGQDARKSFKCLLRSRMPLRFIISGGVTAIHWRLLVDISSFLSWLGKFPGLLPSWLRFNFPQENPEKSA